jgi:hypothetical protein
MMVVTPFSISFRSFALVGFTQLIAQQKDLMHSLKSRLKSSIIRDASRQA